MAKRSEKQWFEDHETFLYVLVGLGVLLLLGVQNVQFETSYDNPSSVTGYAVYEAPTYEPTHAPFQPQQRVQAPVVAPMEEQVDRLNLNDYPHFNNCFVAADCPMGYHCQAQTQTCEKTLQ